MFCNKCGTQVPDNATACPKCGAAAGGASSAAAAAAADKLKAASTDALKAFKMFATNPVGGLAGACESLGPTRSLGVGITFGLVFSLCMVLGVYRILGEFGRPEGFEGFMKILVVALVPFASLFATCFIAEKVFRGQGALGHDSFIAGASLLPYGFVMLMASILGLGNYEIILVLALVAVCLTILMLFAGLTRIGKISERLATIAVPLILLATAWLSKVIYKAMLQNSGFGGGGFPGGGFPGGGF
jgi:hypothetical protein